MSNKRIRLEGLNTQRISTENYPELKDIKNIKRIWTLYDEETVVKEAPFNPYTGEPVTCAEEAVLIHEKGVFLEDYVHDWNVSNDYLHIYSRVVGKDKPITLIIEVNVGS